MSVFCAALLLAVASQAAPAPEADPALLFGGAYGAGLYGHGYGLPIAHAPLTPVLTYNTVVHTGNAVPLAVGGYKAEAGCNGALCGPVHEVGAQVGALALETQESTGAVKLTTGTGHLVATPAVHYIGKRETVDTVAPVVPTPLVYGAHPFTGVTNFVPYAHHVVPTTHAVTYKTYTPTVETNVVATNAAVPVAVGGYKAVAGNNGELMGAVHEVPAIFGAPALNSQVNEASLGSLTVGTSAVVTHTVGKPIVNEHTVQVPTVGVYGGAHYIGKREADATADPYMVYGHGYGNVYGLGYGHGYGHGYGYGLHGYGHNYNYYG